MNNNIYNEIRHYDIDTIKKLYEENSNDYDIAFQYGKMLYKNKNYKKATEVYEALYKINHNKYVALALGRSYAKIKQYEKAKELYIEALKFNPRNYLAMFELGKVELALGNKLEAKHQFENVLKINNDSFATLELGKLEVEAGNYLKAKEIFENLLKVKFDKFVVFELGKVEVLLKNYDDARRLFTNLLGSSSDKFARFELGKLELSLGNISLAREYFETILSISYDYYTVLELGKLEREERNYERAYELFSSILKDHQDIYAKFELACLEFAVGKLESARKLFEELINEDPNGIFFQRYNSYLGTIELGLDNYDKGVEYYNKIKGTTEELEVLIEFAKYAYRQKDYSTCKEYLDKMLTYKELSPNLLKNVYAIYGRMEIANNNLDVAYEWLLKSLNIHYDADVYYELARIHYEKGEIDEAKRILQELINAENHEYAIFLLGKIEIDAQNYDVAKKYLNSLKGTKNELYARYELGKISIIDDNLEEAKEELIGCLNIKNNDEYAIFELAKVEYSLGNIDESINIFKSFYGTLNESYALKALLILYIREKRLLEAFDVLKEIKDNHYDIYDTLELYIMKELNVFFDNMDNYRKSYSNKQVVNYDEFRTLYHIEKHREHLKDFDLNELYKDIPNYLEEQYKEKRLAFCDRYFIPYNDVMLTVITLPNTKDILTIYPKDRIYDENLEEEAMLRERKR